jgi:hypothetical protein
MSPRWISAVCGVAGLVGIIGGSFYEHCSSCGARDVRRLTAGHHALADDLAQATFMLAFRNLGPFRAGAWTVGVAIPETPAKAHRSTIYAALRTGGVWKSSNGGVTFEPVLDSQSIYSVGAIAVAPSDENVVWVGTGDNSATRSAYWGDGVYKSTDAGKTWQNMGLKDTQHIARIVIHPANPDTVYVAALGHLATPNAERGVFKTVDGGKTWKKVLYVGDRVGAVDLVRDPRNPEVLYAAAYEHTRLAWVINDGGPGTGLYKTTDGGANWKELTGGLPKGPMGHIGIISAALSPTRCTRCTTTTTFAGATKRTTRSTVNLRTDGAGATWRKVNRTKWTSASRLLLQPAYGGSNNPDRCGSRD